MTTKIFKEIEILDDLIEIWGSKINTRYCSISILNQENHVFIKYTKKYENESYVEYQIKMEDLNKIVGESDEMYMSPYFKSNDSLYINAKKFLELDVDTLLHTTDVLLY